MCALKGPRCHAQASRQRCTLDLYNTAAAQFQNTCANQHERTTICLLLAAKVAEGAAICAYTARAWPSTLQIATIPSKWQTYKAIQSDQLGREKNLDIDTPSNK